MFRHADVVCLCLCVSCGSLLCCVLHDLQFVNAGLGCKVQPYERGILQSMSHHCLIGSHEYLLLISQSCCMFDRVCELFGESIRKKIGVVVILSFIMEVSSLGGGALLDIPCMCPK